MGNMASGAGYTGKLVGFDVYLKEDFGVKPIIVEEGQAITILVCSTEYTYVFYGYSGYKEERKKIEG